MAARKRAKKRSSQPVYGVPVPEGLHEAIEIQRGNLAKAESVLGCLIASMEYKADSVDGPYYPDVAEIARELVKQSIKGLDSLVLQRCLSRNKVREHLDPTCAEQAYPVSYH
jgi:isopentenyl diphosphate isomerase/L-lactate dehydrogenase-like FMN-dependent dehydrogenase